MVDLYNRRFFDYEVNRDLVFSGKTFEQCCIALGNIGQKGFGEEPGDRQGSSLFDSAPSVSPKQVKIPSQMGGGSNKELT